MSLKSIPPQRASKNILSDLVMLNFIRDTPITKFIIESSVPSKMDLKIKSDITDRRKSINTMSSVRQEIKIQIIKSCFSFFIISGFQSRFNKSV